MIKTAIIGASGYSGRELLKMLSAREDVSIQHVFANSAAGESVNGNGISHGPGKSIVYEKYNGKLPKPVDIVFISLPAGESMKIVPSILGTGIKVIDLGGDYRLKNAEQYLKYYNIKHLSSNLLNNSVYGLSEIYEKEIADANLVANPGCYPTSILLPLIPVLKNGIVSPAGIVINSLSGVTGAGKKETFEYSFGEVNENIRAYKLLNHQHIPEIEQVLEREFKAPLNFSFVPHLVPLNRGIYTTIVADLSNEMNEQYIYDIYNQCYFDCPFVRLKKEIPQIRDVVNTNFCDIYFKLDKKRNKIILISSIDNLIKGAAGQAIQNMNIMFRLSQSYGFFKKKKEYV